MTKPAELALKYLERRWCPLPVPFMEKGPRIKGWTEFRFDGQAVERHFPERTNIGVLLGAPSGNLVDVDLDCAEACTIAREVLPVTGAIFGRKSKPASHLLYVAELATAKFLDPVDKSTLLEIRSTGCQTVFPGSVHPSGEAIDWHDDGQPAIITPGDLLQATRWLAAAAILARHWAGNGGRHEAQLTLAACLARSGWEVADIAHFLEHVSVAAGGERDPQKRLQTAQDAVNRLRSGRLLRGIPALIELVGEPVTNKVIEWLELKPQKSSHVLPGSTARSHPVVQMVPLRINSEVEIARRLYGQLEQRLGEIVWVDGKLWHYAETHWTALDDNTLRKFVHEFDAWPVVGSQRPVKLDKRRIDGIIHELTVITAKPAFFDDAPEGINCTSGFISFGNGNAPHLLPHHPNLRSRYTLAGRWPAGHDDETARASLLIRLLSGVFKGDRDAQAKINLLGEVMASAVLGKATRLKQPCALVLHGATAENGKSQILDLMRFFLPKEIVSAIPPHKLPDEKHLVQLAGKVLNASDELSSAAAISTDIFKQAVTGDPLSARDVYKSAVNFRPRAQHVFATNMLPAFAGGMDRGVRRRLLVLEFNRTIPLEERVSRIGERVATEEPDVVLDWIVQAASRLLEQQAFTMPPSSVIALRDWFLGSDPVLAWAEEAIALDPHAPRIPTSEAYRHFKAWATHEGFSIARLPAVAAFTQRLIAGGPGIHKARTGRARQLVGLRLLTLPVSLRSSARMQDIG